MVNKLRRLLLMSIIMGCLICGLIGCGSKNENKVIRISISKSYGTATSNIMKEYGLLERYLPEGYTVEWVTMTSASDMRDALVSGDIDMVCTSLSTFIMGYENGLPLRLVSFAGGVPIGLYGNDNDINSLSDFSLDDRIAAKSKGNNGHMAFLIACQEELGNALGLDNQIVTIQEAEALALLQSSSDYQASIFSFPMTIKAQDAGLNEIFNFNEIIDEYGIGSTYFTRTTFYEDEPRVIEAIKLAQAEALSMIQENPEDVAKKLAPVFELDEKYILDAFNEMPPRIGYTGYDKLAKLMFEIGLIEKTPTLFNDLPNYEDIK